MSIAHADSPPKVRPPFPLLVAFGAGALGVGLARGIATTYLPVVLDALREAPTLIGLVMLVNPLAGFVAPLAVGLWSDRRRGPAPRVPFVLGGSLLAAGGLVAIAAGTASSYLVLAVAGLATYVGLSGGLTAQRASIAARFPADARAALTSSQELQRSAGSLLGVVAGGVLVATAPQLLFLVAAVAVGALALPTVGVLRRREGEDEPESDEQNEDAGPRALIVVLRRPGAREVVIAQGLWVLAYVALPTFFVLYAREVLGLQPSASSFVLGGVGVLAGAGMLVGGRVRVEAVQPALIAGAVMLGVGLTVATALTDVVAVLAPFGVAAFGFGLVNTLGFAYFSRFIDEGAAGRFSGVYFAVRAVAAAVALPLAGLMIEVTGSYRGVLLQGVAAFLAVVPLVRAGRLTSREETG